MKYYMPAAVIEEKDCVASHAADMASLGRKALIVTGKSSAKICGAFDDAARALEGQGVSYALFDGVEENPSVETIMKARDLGVKEEADFVIGIGGGSPMDAAKAIALMIKHKDQGWEYMYDSSASSDALPVVLIPTTCGTGSEVTGISVLTRHEKRAKGSIPHRIFAKYALLDGKYLASAPRQILANTSIDAFAHLVESYINAKANRYSRMCAEKGIEVWALSKDVILGKREAKEQDLTNMLDASCLAGIAIAQTGTSLPHALSYRLTYDAHVPHGQACGYYLADYVREADPADAARVLQLAGFADADAMQEYYALTCGVPQVSKDVLEQSLREVATNPAKCALPPFAVDEALLRRMSGLD